MVCNVCKQLRRSHKDITYIIRSASHKNTFCFQIRGGISLLSLHQPSIWCWQTSCSRQRSFVAWGCMRCAVQKYLPCLPDRLGIQPWWMVWWLSWAALSHRSCLNDQPAKQLFFFSHSERNFKMNWVLTESWSRFTFYSVDEREVHTRVTVNIYLNILDLTENWWTKESLVVPTAMHWCSCAGHGPSKVPGPQHCWGAAKCWAPCQEEKNLISIFYSVRNSECKHFFFIFFSFSERVRMK